MHKKTTLSKILKLKDSRKKEIEVDVKKAVDRVDEEKARLQELERHLTDSTVNFNEKSSEGSMDINSMNTHYDFFSRIIGKISEQKKKREQSESELAELKRNLVEAHKEKRVIEIMHEKALTKEKRVKMDSEQKESDFLAISRRIK